MKAIPCLTSTALLSLLSASASAALYTADFEIDDTANWTVNNGPSDAAADFFFDYSTAGIPAAPSGAGTRGLKLQANQSSGVFGGMSASLTNFDLPSAYTLKFDWWANVNGPFPAGGSGSTQLSTFGVGTAGTSAQWPGGTQDSVWFAATGDGNSSSDWRAYSSAAATSYPDASPVYAAGPVTGNRNSSNAYYSSLGGVSAPAAQLALFPQQTGSTGIGASGMAWHQVEINKSDTAITWFVDGLLIATVDPSTVSLGGNKFFFGHSDTNATSSTDPNDVNLLFTLVDNVVVVPEPGTASVLGLAALCLMARRRR
jgi:hypothetical protein